MFEIIFSVAITAYFIQTVIFLISVRKKFKKLPYESLPAATVIVAARNEEHTIIRCLQSLEALEYPENRLQIIIVDDHSTDGTGKMIDTFIAGKPQFSKVIAQNPKGHLRGKANAIDSAMTYASGDIILTTDADCTVPTSWAKTIASYYTSGVGMVNGFTFQEAKNGFEGMQSLDFIYLLFVASGTINSNMPVSCIGNNMSYLKKAYHEAGGYENLPFSVTEDAQLLLAINRLNKYKLIFPLDKGSLADTLSCPDIKSLFRQKKRWAVGGLSVPWYAAIVLLSGFAANVFLLAAPFQFTAAIGTLVFLKILLDFLVLSLLTNTLGIQRIMRFFPLFQIYFLLYVVMLPFVVAFSRTVFWKGRTL